MIDKSVLKRLLSQSSNGLGNNEIAGDCILSQDRLLLLANVCSNHGKSELLDEVSQLKNEIISVNFENKILSESLNKCSAGEWVDYPDNLPKDDGFEYIVKVENGTKTIAIFQMGVFFDLIGRFAITNVKSFAKLK